MLSRRLLVLFTLLLSAPAAWAESQLDFSAGYRRDSMRWKGFSGDFGGIDAFPANEARWAGMNLLTGRASLRWTPANQWLILGDAELAYSISGKNQLTTFTDNNHSIESSRSNNDTDSAPSWNLSLAVGYTITFQDETINRPAYITPLIGFMHLHQEYVAIDGYQTLPGTGTFSGLNSEYQSTWQGIWLGLDLDFPQFRDDLSFNALFAYQFGEYTGEGNWNLRTGYEHPKSFTHKASKADGLSVALKTTYHIQLGDLSLLIGDNRREASNGTETRYLSNSTQTQANLPSIYWQSFYVQLGYRLALN